MLDIKFIRENPDAVRENIKKKFQDAKLPLVDQVLALDEENRAAVSEANELRANRNALSKQVGMLMGQAKKDPSKLEEAEAVKAQVKANADRLAELESKETELAQQIRHIMLQIPNIIDPSVPIGPDDSCNVEVQRFGEPVVPDFEIPYHTQIMESFNGIDMDAAGRVSGNGFYYLMGDIARLHEAVLAYARDFMINKGFTFCIPPFMIHGNVVEGVMSQTEMDAMMYKIEGEDLYLIGTSEHSMIGKFIDQIIPEESLPQTLTSYSPCFRKEKGAHGIEERGVYRIHQFEKQEMVVVCKPEDSMKWYEQMWRYSVELFRSLDIPVRQLECCSGDLADLKVKSCDIEAWSPRQQKYFEVCSCSNLGDAQARRLKMRVKGEKGTYLPHTLNNTVVAPPRMLIAFLENNLQADGTVKIPAVLQPYMGGTQMLTPKLFSPAISRVRAPMGPMTAFKISFCNFFKEYNDLFYPSPADSASPPLVWIIFAPGNRSRTVCTRKPLRRKGFRVQRGRGFPPLPRPLRLLPISEPQEIERKLFAYESLHPRVQVLYRPGQCDGPGRRRHHRRRLQQHHHLLGQRYSQPHSGHHRRKQHRPGRHGRRTARGRCPDGRQFHQRHLELSHHGLCGVLPRESPQPPPPEKGGDPRTSPGALPGRAAAHRDPGPAEREDLMEEKKIPPQEEQDAPAPYTPASPVKRTMAWIGVVYMVILVAMMTYYYFTGSMLVNMAPLLAVPGLIGLGILALVSWRTTGRPGKWPAIALAAVCFLAALATLPLGIVGLLSNFSLVGVFVTGAP